MTDKVEFFIPGTPIPQGSKTIAKGGGKVWLRDANSNALKAWRHAVATVADRGVDFDVPVTVSLEFYLPAPKRPRWWVPAVKPDVDKLSRAVLDGLTDGGLLFDDSRVVGLSATKRYATPEAPVGVQVKVRAF